MNEKPNVKDEARFTIDQTATLLGVHYNTIMNWIKRGTIKPREYGFRRVDKRRFVTGKAIKRLWQEVY